jgi:hypothetical protein
MLKANEELSDNSLIYPSAFQLDTCFVTMSLYFDFLKYKLCVYGELWVPTFIR